MAVPVDLNSQNKTSVAVRLEKIISRLLNGEFLRLGSGT